MQQKYADKGKHPVGDRLGRRDDATYRDRMRGVQSLQGVRFAPGTSAGRAKSLRPEEPPPETLAGLAARVLTLRVGCRDVPPRDHCFHCWLFVDVGVRVGTPVPLRWGGCQ